MQCAVDGLHWTTRLTVLVSIECNLFQTCARQAVMLYALLWIVSVKSSFRKQSNPTVVHLYCCVFHGDKYNDDWEFYITFTKLKHPKTFEVAGWSCCALNCKDKGERWREINACAFSSLMNNHSGTSSNYFQTNKSWEGCVGRIMNELRREEGSLEWLHE